MVATLLARITSKWMYSIRSLRTANPFGLTFIFIWSTLFPSSPLRAGAMWGGALPYSPPNRRQISALTPPSISPPADKNVFGDFVSFTTSTRIRAARPLAIPGYGANYSYKAADFARPDKRRVGPP